MEDIPKEFLCPINHLPMEYPFLTAAGNSYEYSAIIRWLQSNSTDPLSRMDLTGKMLIPNYGLRSLIQSWREANPEAWDELCQEPAEKPPKEAYLMSREASSGTPLDRVLRFRKSFDISKVNRGHKQRLLQQDRMKTVCAQGHVYTWDAEGKKIQCDNGPWVNAPDSDMFVTPMGVVFYDCREVCDCRVLPGTDLAEECYFKSNCTNPACAYAHPFVCRYGVSCRYKDDATRKCKFFHPPASSVVPIGRSYPLNQECKYRAACSNTNCFFAHSHGRLAIARHAARIFVKHSLTLEKLATPIELPIEWPAACTSYQIQGEFVFCFEPYEGTWAKEHYRCVTVQRFDARSGRYRVVGTYSLNGHYCNCAVGAGRYFVISFWPYEEEAIRTVWECLRMSRLYEKSLKSSAAEIASLRTETSSLKSQLNAKDAEIRNVQAQLKAKTAETHRVRAQMTANQRAHENQVRGLQQEANQARNEVRKQQAQYREMQNRYERERNERLRLRDPIHVYALQAGRSGFHQDDWVMVLDYHKGAHDLTLSSPIADEGGRQILEVVEHSTAVQFEMCVPHNVSDIGAPLPIQPGRLCAEF